MLLLDVTETEIAASVAEVIAGENATPVSSLPEIWQAIARGESNTRLSEPDIMVKMAQLFHYKLTHADVDLFNERDDLTHLKQCYGELLAQLADETLDFYGHDFGVKRYPDFDTVFRELEDLDGSSPEMETQISERFDVARICVDLFSEFGYDVPASFYRVHLAPLYRDHIFEERALRFDPRDQNHKRPWDAVLHAGKVFAVQAKIQSIASQYGLSYQHGCGCDSHVSAIDKSVGAFDYNFDTPKRNRWLRSYIWTMWYEFAFFGLIPNTAYLTKALR